MWWMEEHLGRAVTGDSFCRIKNRHFWRLQLFHKKKLQLLVSFLFQDGCFCYALEGAWCAKRNLWKFQLLLLCVALGNFFILYNFFFFKKSKNAWRKHFCFIFLPFQSWFPLTGRRARGSCRSSSAGERGGSLEGGKIYSSNNFSQKKIFKLIPWCTIVSGEQNEAMSLSLPEDEWSLTLSSRKASSGTLTTKSNLQRFPIKFWI